MCFLNFENLFISVIRKNSDNEMEILVAYFDTFKIVFSDPSGIKKNMIQVVQ